LRSLRPAVVPFRRLAAVTALAAALAPALAAQPTAPPAPPAPVEAGYRLGPRDLVRIRVFEVPELNVESRVSETGAVVLPLIGDVPASGLTASEFEARLEGLLEARYVNRASVSVEVVEFRSRPITVIGAVRQPGHLAFPGGWTLLDALAAAGGLADNHGDLVYVMRRAENGLSDQVAIPVDDLFVRGDPDSNLPIRANDLIHVPPRVEISVYCLGEVRQPGAIVFDSTDRITLLAVLARAGGLTDRASKKVRIKRRAGEALGAETVVDYRRVLAGEEPDPVLEAGDVVVVKEAFF
jgi:polysaccharide export outer membrane protein